MLTAEEIRFILGLLKERCRDAKVATLQAKLSIMLEAAQRREQVALSEP